MPCDPFEFPDGTRGIICSRGRRRQWCACGKPATLLCDAPTGPTGKRTCSRPLCAACTTKDGAVDLCPAHAPKPAAPARPRAEIRGLTLHQPWAWAITHSDKRVENREWAPPDWLLGGFIAIHAGRTLDRAACRHLAAEFGLPCDADAAAMRAGEVVAVARLARVVRAAADLPADQARWWCGPIGWLLADVVTLPHVVPCRGAQGLWPLPPDVLARVRVGWKEVRGG